MTAPTVGQVVYLHSDGQLVGTGGPVDVTVRGVLDGTVMCGGTLAAVPVNVSWGVWCQTGWTTTAGTHTLTWDLDYLSAVDETDESNNSSTLIFPPGAATLDLVAQRAYLRTGVSGGGTEVDTPTVGLTVYFHLDWQVNGSGSAVPVDLRAVLDGSTFCSGTTSPVSPGNSYFVSCGTGWSTTAGSHTLTWDLDYNGTVPETDEGNNSTTKNFTPPAQGIDVVATRAYLRTAASGGGTEVLSPSLGQVVYLHLDWQIIGSGNAAAVDVRALLDGTLYCSSTSAPIAPGTSVVTSCPAGWTATSGNHTLTWDLDYNGLVTENNEGNNSATKIVSVASTIDIAATRAYIRNAPTCGGSELAQPSLGQKVYFHMDWQVTGSSGPLPVSQRAILDGTTFCSFTTSVGNGTYHSSCSQPWTGTAGPHTLQWDVDYANAIAEPNEGNNSASASMATMFPTVGVSPSSLKFGATKAGAGGALTAVTGAQPVTVAFTGTASAWTASPNQSWLQVTGGSGSGNGSFSVSIVNPGNVIAGGTSLSGSITVSAPSTSNSPVTVNVTLTVDQTGTSTQAAFGQVDTPVQSATGIVGAIGVTGWAIDDIGLNGVRLYRNCLGFDDPLSCQMIAGYNVVFIGDAAFVPGARPDVESAFPSYPAGNVAGWGYLLLTNMLPNVSGSLGFGGQGAITLYVMATDLEGHVTLLGRSQGDHTPTSITMANTGIAKPFGAIDTPSQGGIVSATFPNFGWVLTPDSNSIADGGDILMPITGSTITVYIDGVGVGTVTYNQCRGNVGNPVPGGVYCNDDVSNIFGNSTPQPVFTTRTSNPTPFRNLDAGRSAIGSFDVNTSAMTNGMHSIAWGVSDSAGRGEGIGSRNFFVLNASGPMLLGQAQTALSAVEADAAASDGRHLLQQQAVQSRGDIASLPEAMAPANVIARTGFSPRAPFADIAADADGVRRIEMPDLGRVELRLDGVVGEGHLLVGRTLRDLPGGSHLNAATGTFTWAPAPGYLGTYHFVFVVNGQQLRIDVTIRPR